MMLEKLHATIVAVLLVAASALGAADGPIRLPVSPAIPDKMPPAPSPDAITRLAGDALFVIDSDVPVIVLASPANLVLVTEESGPVKIRGRFVDGNGRTETRTYKGKQVVTVEAVASGKVELLIVPVGATKTSDVIRRTIDVDAGQGPIPPPKPPDPKPDPVDPSAPIPAPGLRVLIVYESADLAKYTPAQNGILFSAKAREYLNAACVVGPDNKTREYRIWDKDTATDGESKLWQDAMKRDRKSVPWVIVSNGKTGYEGPLPANTDEFLTLVKRFEVK